MPGPNQARIVVGPSEETHLVGDLDGDGYPEITRHTPAPDYSGDDSAYDAVVEVGDLRGRVVDVSEVTLATGNPVWMPMGDWDGDDHPDLFGWGGIWSGARIAEGDFGEPLVSTDPWQVSIDYVLPDFDGDGVNDLAVFEPTARWAVGSVGVGTQIDDPSAVGTRWDMLSAYDASGDLDGDGHADVVCGSADGLGIWSVSAFPRG